MAPSAQAPAAAPLPRKLSAAGASGTTSSSSTTAAAAAPQSYADEAARYLARAAEMSTAFMRAGELADAPVARWPTSRELRQNVRLALPDAGASEEEVFASMQSMLDNSINPYTGRFLDKLYSAPRPVGLAAEALLATLNANGHVMSASPMLSLAEEACVAGLAELCGWDTILADGMTMPGGSASNTLAVQTALQRHFPAFRDGGVLGASLALAASGRSGRAARPLLFTSSQSHYSLDKAAMGCGLGLDAVVKVPCDVQGRMDPVELERLVKEAVNDTEGKAAAPGSPFFVNATAGSTVLGSFDDLNAIADVCERYGLWLHVDGSWGGPVLFSDRWRHLMDGIARCDSLAINPHKLLNAPLQCSFALFRRGETLCLNSLDVAYLFHESSDEAAQQSNQSASEQAEAARLARREHPGSMAYGCGRRGDALKLYLLWQRYGRQGLGAHVDAGFALAARVSELVRSGAHAAFLELGPQPDPLFLQVCFRPKEPTSHAAAAADAQTRTRLRTKATRHVYDTLRERRRFAVDFAPLPGEIGDFVRLVVHPRTAWSDLQALVVEIAEIGKDFFAAN